MSADYFEELRNTGREVLGAHTNAEGSTWFTKRRTWPFASPQLPKLRRPAGKPGSRMIATATGLLFLLGAGLLGVSLAAQYRYLLHERHQHWAVADRGPGPGPGHADLLAAGAGPGPGRASPPRPSGC